MGDHIGTGTDWSRRVLTVPNAISSLRLCLVPAFAVAFAGHHDLAGVVLLGLVGSSDWIDGFVARKTGQVSNVGKLLDPLADRVAIVVALVVLLSRRALPWGWAAAIIARDVAMAPGFLAMLAGKLPKIPVTFMGKAATFIIYSGAGFYALWLVLHSLGAPAGLQAGDRLLGSISLGVGGALYWAAGGVYLRALRRRLKQKDVSGG